MFDNIVCDATAMNTNGFDLDSGQSWKYTGNKKGKVMLKKVILVAFYSTGGAY